MKKGEGEGERSVKFAVLCRNGNAGVPWEDLGQEGGGRALCFIYNEQAILLLLALLRCVYVRERQADILTEYSVDSCGNCHTHTSAHTHTFGFECQQAGNFPHILSKTCPSQHCVLFLSI